MLHALPALLAVATVMSAATDSRLSAPLTAVVTVALDDLGTFDVVSSEDVRQAIALEGDRQAVGCSQSECLAEIAGAMGARLVVFGQLGELDDVYLLTLNLFDSEAASSVGRVLVEGEDLGELRARVPAAVAELVEKANVSADEPKLRVLVLDLEDTTSGAGATAPGTATADAATSDDGLGLIWLAAGGTTIGVGVLAFGAGALFGLLASNEHELASDGDTRQAEAVAAYEQRDTNSLIANVGYGVGAALVVAGAVLTALAFIPAGE